MIVNIQDILHLNAKIAAFNSIPFEKIIWYNGDKKLDIPKDKLEQFKFTGLSNRHFPDFIESIL